MAKNGTERAHDLREVRGGFIESLIAHALPGIGYKRQRARARSLALQQGVERIRRYEAAAGGRRTAGWVRPGSSANAEIGPALHRLRAGSRDLRRNNQWADKAIRVRADDMVGTGIRPLPKPAQGGVQAAMKVHGLWADWAESTACDPEGLLTFYAMQDLICQAIDESGEVLLRRRARRLSDNLPVPLQLQILEADHLDTLRDGYRMENGHRVIQGVEYDALGRRAAYYLYPDHPGENFHTSSFTSQRVPASEVLHLYDILRPGQVRGIPRGTPCLLRTRDFDDMEDAVLLRQKIANLYVGFIHDIDATVETSSTFDEADVDEMEPGTYEHLPAGRTVTFANPPHAQGYTDYAKISLRAIAAGYGVTYEALTGDLTQVNFSSGRMGRLQHERAIAKSRSNLVIPRLCQPVWEWFLETAVIAGTLPSTDVRAAWTPPGKEMIDPAKEVKAKTASIASGFTSLSSVIRETGRHPREVLEELAEDKKLAESLGLELDIFAEEPAPEPPAPDPEDDPEDDELEDDDKPPEALEDDLEDEDEDGKE